MTEKKYSKAEIASILKKVKLSPINEVDIRFERLENALNVAFSAITQLRGEIDSLHAQINRIEAVSAPKDIRAEKFEVVPKKKATSMIMEYISKHPGSRTSEVISDLHLDPDLVLEILRKLKKDKKVRSEEIV